MSRPPSPRPAPPTSPASPGRPTSRRSAATACPRWAPARTRSRCCTPTDDGPDERAAFKAQVDALGVGTTLLVDTYDITQGVANAVEVAGTELGAVRIDSGDLGVLARQVRDQLDALGATKTRIVVSGDLDEFAIAALRAEPVDSYGVGTSVVTGSGAPTASMVYKLVEVDGMPVEKRSSHKESHGGRKQALRLAKPSGTILEEVVHPGRPTTGPTEPVARADGPPGPRRASRSPTRHRPRRAALVAPVCTACHGTA